MRRVTARHPMRSADSGDKPRIDVRPRPGWLDAGSAYAAAALAALALGAGLAATAGGLRPETSAGLPPVPISLLAAMLSVACGALVLLCWRSRTLQSANRRLEARVEELSDCNWELRDAEERAKSLVDAQGDVILRRDAEGAITYANDAFCALAGRSREALLGGSFRL